MLTRYCWCSDKELFPSLLGRHKITHIMCHNGKEEHPGSRQNGFTYKFMYESESGSEQEHECEIKVGWKGDSFLNLVLCRLTGVKPRPGRPWKGTTSHLHDKGKELPVIPILSPCEANLQLGWDCACEIGMNCTSLSFKPLLWHVLRYVLWKVLLVCNEYIPAYVRYVFITDQSVIHCWQFAVVFVTYKIMICADLTTKWHQPLVTRGLSIEIFTSLTSIFKFDIFNRSTDLKRFKLHTIYSGNSEQIKPLQLVDKQA